MKKYSNLLKRSQALVLAVALMLSVMSPALWLNVSAEDKTPVVKTDGEIVADNYDLTEAEKNLLGSGVLVGETHTYTVPDANDGLISVEIDSKTIKAESYEKENGYKWVPVSATIVVGEDEKETITITDGSGKYTFDGDAFSVKVNYVLNREVDADTQKALLSAPAALKQGVASMNAIGKLDTNLGVVVEAMDSLVALANTMSFTQPIAVDVSFATQEAKDAVYALDEQLDANGALDLQTIIAEYAAAEYKVAYIAANGAAIKAALEATYTAVNAIANDGIFTNTLLLYVLQNQRPDMHTQVMAIQSILKTLASDMAAVLESDWSVATTDYVVTEMSDNQRALLDARVAALGETTDASSLTIKNPLVVDTTTIQFNMSMYDVTVKVVLKNATSQDTLVDYDSYTATVTMSEGVTAEEIANAVEKNGVVAAALANWKAPNYADGQFDVTYSELPDTLVADVDYVITFTPKTYDVTFVYDDKVEQYYYGSYVTLEKSDVEGSVYDYTVNGESVSEGVKWFVDGDLTIDRTAGKPYVNSTLNQVISDRYFAAGSKAYAILTSGALTIGNAPVNVRYPDNDNGLVGLKEDVLTVGNYPSSYAGLDWVPYSYVVVTGAEKSEPVLINGATEVTIGATSYDRVEVNYRLALTNVAADTVLAILGAPETLTSQANAQKDALDRLAAYHTSMGQLDKTKLGALNGVIDVTDLHSDPATNEKLRAEFKAVVSDIIEKCLDSNNYLRIYNLLSNYVDANNGGLGYYYKNSAAIIGEIDTLSSYLTAMLADDQKVAALETLVGAAGFPEYAEKIKDLESAMADVKAALLAPSASINVTSENLNKLIAALEMSGAIDEYDSGSLYLSDVISVNADNKTTLSVSIQIGSGKPVTVFENTYGNDDLVDVDAIVDAITLAIKAEAGLDAFYTTDFDAAAILALDGKTAKELADYDFSFNWTPKSFTVIVDGEEQTVTVEDLEIDLPDSPTAATRYEYMIDGAPQKPGVYKFTTEQLTRLFVDGKYTVVLNKVDVARETLVNTVDKLNDAVGSDTIVFALVENNGAYSIVMKVNAANTGALTGAAKAAAMGFVNAGFAYIGVDGEGLIYMDETNTMKISLQSLVNAAMNSGSGTDTIVKLMNANGVINNMTLPGTIASAKKLTALGGEVMVTSLQLGNSASDAIDVPFYVTLGSAPAALVQVRNLIAGRAGNYVSADLANGSANVNLTMPKKAYEAYLAVLLATENVDISDIDAVNGEIAVGFIKDLVDPLFTGNVTTTTLTNTLEMVGYNLDLTGYEKLWQMLCEVYGTCTFTYDAKSGTASGNVDIAALLDRLNLGDLAKMIVEYETGIDFNAKLTINNIGTEYEALYIDVRADGVTNKAGLATNLSAQLAKMAGGAVVVLLNDVEGDLTFNTTTVLNLNGFKVNGDLICNGNVIVVDTAQDATGEVTGTVTGDADIIGGKYASDVTAFIKEGYAQKDGVVSSKYFDLSKDADGNIVVAFDAGVLAMNSLPDIRAIALDVATEILFNGYTVNSLYVDDNMVYNISIEDLVGIYAGSDRVDDLVDAAVNMFESSELANLVNTILADISDFGALRVAVESDKELLSYDVVTGVWSVELDHVTEGDYLSANLTSSKEETRELKVIVTGSEENKATLAGILEVLAETVDATITVTGNDGFPAPDSKNFILDWSASADIAFDLTNPNYAILMSVIIADGMGAPANEALVAGIQSFYKTGKMGLLQAAFDDLTINQIIKAFEKVNRGDSFTAMVNNLGLEAYVDDEVVAIEKLFDRFVKVAAAALRRVDIDRGSRTVGSFYEGFENGAHQYGASVENIDKTFSRDLFRGYGVTIDLAVTNVNVAVDIFTDVVKAPVLNTPAVSTNDKIAGAWVDVENKYIFIDVHPDGITPEELVNALTFPNAENVEDVEIVVSGEALVCNGATMTATGSNTYTGYTDVVEYTIIVLGDVNANGRNESGDSALISKYLVDMEALDNLALLAGDINRNGRADVGDAAIVAKKTVDWDNYVSSLKDE